MDFAFFSHTYLTYTYNIALGVWSQFLVIITKTFIACSLL